ncbi:MAG TPA: helix-turn-helix transcriptional regulator [Syntrophomonadaceae bacterium]|nr:helix-turn-helix transcriptional regulator [Syntrophomonadaceae bacterium]
MDFGKKLKKILAEMNITQREFAEMTGKEETYISKVVNNRYNVSWDMVVQFANALNISPSTFFEEKEDEIIASAIRSLPDDLIEFVKSRPNAPYLYLAKDLQEGEYTPDEIKQLVELWENTVKRSRKKEDL